MYIRIVVASLTLALMALSAGAGTLVIPAVGRGPGANGSFWQSELAIHNASSHTVELKLSLHYGQEVRAFASVAVAARGTKAIPDALAEFFNHTGGGAIRIEGNDADLRALAVTSRTYNLIGDGNYGQDVGVYDISEALGPADLGTVVGPSFPADTRMNFGIFAVESARVIWQLVRWNGTLAAQREELYTPNEHRQYNRGVETFFGVVPDGSDTVYARIQTGKAFVYGSIVNATGDPTFVPGVRTRDNIHLLFKGVDIDEDGTLDVKDANLDGVLDKPLAIKTSLFPYHFRIEAVGDFGEWVKYELISSPTTTEFTDDQGTMKVIAGANVQGTTGEIVFKVTSQETFAIFRIPVYFY